QTVAEVAERFAASDIFYGHGTQSAWDEAVALVTGVTGLPDDRGAAATELEPSAVEHIDQLAGRRIHERIPLAYLLGRVTYVGREFLIEPGIMIPRSPIAQLINSAFRPWWRQQEPPGSIVDVCSGCGCLGILCALEFPDAEVTLVEIEPAAVDIARRNVALHGLEERVRVVRSDLFQAFEPQSWDLIVSNPPYVDSADLGALPQEYRHEPALGLAGGRDGLDIVARLLDALPDRLASGGLFVCEVGASSAALLRRYPREPFIWPDLPDGGEGVFVLEGNRRAGA
ncbi:MAG: 50S ribosomal protein L3 N(5)-glutamine methyltransferase, partial [Gammaproteobacteria bacterium]|nr:50S ribosomal protein L3 N(5)-glutamine methyltransferase [Gammaproteobacteria bacterium]